MLVLDSVERNLFPLPTELSAPSNPAAHGLTSGAAFGTA